MIKDGREREGELTTVFTSPSRAEGESRVVQLCSFLMSKLDKLGQTSFLSAVDACFWVVL